MTSCWLSPRWLAPTVTGYRSASCAVLCRISASIVSSPQAWAAATRW
jgi:hypothetical protein